MEAIVYRTVAFSAAFSNKTVGRLATKGGELDPDNKKKSGLALTKKRIGSDNLQSEICVDYLVSVIFFRQL